jgi:hypothetical protein
MDTMDAAQKMEYLESHPPRVASGFEVMTVSFPDFQFDGHGEELNPAFWIKCKCGSELHRINGFKFGVEDGYIFLSPLELECTKCAAHSPLLDTDLHGYDAELGHGSSTRRAEGEATHFRCASCSGSDFNTFVRFEYPDDLFDGGFDDTGKAIEDLFTWVTCVGRCGSCQGLWVVADFECA